MWRRISAPFASIDRAVPLGLVLNKAVTNSIKHAFGDASGRVFVKLQVGVGFGEGRLTATDNGQGIQKDLAGGPGLILIDSLARQIGGQVKRESSPAGTSISVTFPIIG